MQSVRQCTGASTTGRVAPVPNDSSAARSHQHPALPSSSRLRSVYRLEAASFTSRAHSRYPQRELLSRCQPQCVHARAVQCSAVSATWDVSERPAPGTRLQRAAVFTAAFTIYFCISWLTRPTAAVASATSALTSSGASKAGEMRQQLSAAREPDTRCTMLHETLREHQRKAYFAAAQGAVRSGYAGLAAGCLHSLAGVDHLAVCLSLAGTACLMGLQHA